MWRSTSGRFFFRTLLSGPAKPTGCRWAKRPIRRPLLHLFSSSSASATPTASPSPPSSTAAGAAGHGITGGATAPPDGVTFAEAKRLMRLANVEALKRKLERDGEEVIGYSQLLEACEGMGLARTREEAVAFARVLDEAGVVLLFRDKVYLHPDKIVDLIRRAVPLVLEPENDPRIEELKQLQRKKEEIDMLAHKQPIAFFTTTTGIVVGYAYFLVTSKDPTYQDLMKRLFLSRQRKLCRRYNFDMGRYMELQKHCKDTLDETAGV